MGYRDKYFGLNCSVKTVVEKKVILNFTLGYTPDLLQDELNKDPPIAVFLIELFYVALLFYVASWINLADKYLM